MTLDPTPRSDYEHHNEERDLIWYQEVGRFGADEPMDPDDYMEYGYGPGNEMDYMDGEE